MLNRRIFRRGTDELQTRYRDGVYDDPHRRHARWRQRSKVNVIRSCRHSNACLPITRQRNPIIGWKVVGATANISHQFQGQKVKDQGHYWPLNVVSENEREGRPTKFKLGISTYGIREISKPFGKPQCILSYLPVHVGCFDFIRIIKRTVVTMTSITDMRDGKVITSRRQFDKEKSQNHQHWHEDFPCYGWRVPLQCQGQKVKVTKPLWVAVQVTNCKPHSLLIVKRL